MAICIIAVIAIGAISVGLLASFGSMNFGPWTRHDATTTFEVENLVGSTTGPVSLDVDLTTGTVNIHFEDNATLLFKIAVEVQNDTLAIEGNPSVSFVSNVISLDYPTAEVNVTLGSGVNYTLDITTVTGTIACSLTDGAHVGDISLQATTGAISLLMTDDVVIVGSPDFNLNTGTGSITVVASFPEGIGASIEASTTVGSIDVNALGWTEITPSHYESTDYDTALQTVTITAVTDVGSVAVTVI